MKEQLESNILTKYAAGLMEAEELRKLEDWLKQNPQFRTTLALIQQNVRAMNMQVQFVTK
jgi:anti-sigma-K factor RskA